MAHFSFQYLEIAVVLFNGLGLVALIAVLCGVLKRHCPVPFWRSVLLGLAFAVCGVADMIRPVEAMPGVFVDFRSVTVGLAAAFAGWPGALFAGLATGWYRVEVLGGPSVLAGCASILIGALAGLLWHGLVAEEKRTRTPNLLLLGLLISVNASPYLFVSLPKDLTAGLILLQALASLLGSLVLGKLVAREASHIIREHALASDASSDPLTRLPNRRSFEREAARMRALDPGGPIALLMVDADHFKLVNDRHGHGVGDEVLRRLAEMLRQNLRDADRVARHGGEEFTLLLPATGEAEAVRIAERLRRRIDEDVFVIDGIYLRLTISIGLAVSTGSANFADLMQAADKALYDAKANGRNRTERARSDWEAAATAGSAEIRMLRSGRAGGGEIVERPHLMEA